jgi:hypothetical protein
MTGAKPLPKRALHIVLSRASSFRCKYSLPSSFSSFLRLLPRLPVTSIPPFIFRSITCRRRQFLRFMWPIKLAYRLLISCTIFLCSLTLSNTSSFLTWSVQTDLIKRNIHITAICFYNTPQKYLLKAVPVSVIRHFLLRSEFNIIWCLQCVPNENRNVLS